MENSSGTSADRPFLPQPPLSIGHLLILTAGVGIAIPINGFEWRKWDLESVLQGAEIGIQGFVFGVAWLGLIRWAQQAVNPSSPRYRTLPGHMLAYLWIVVSGVRLISEAAIPWLGTAPWAGKVMDARREIIFLFVIQLLALPAITLFRHKVKGSLGWHLVALAILIQSLVNLLMLGLSASYHATGNSWTLAASNGLANPVSFVIQWGLVVAAILFALVYERFTRSHKIDWLHTASAVVIMAGACLYLFVHVVEAIG